MIGYRYDNDGYLIGQIEVQESPIEPGVFLMPPSTTTSAPPTYGMNQIPKFSGGIWSLQPNYSGTPYYKKSDKSIKYFAIGEAFSSDYTNVTPPSPDYSYIMWSEQKNNWAIDAKLKSDYDKNTCKQTAKGKIAQYDWINDETTTPKLTNKQDFYTYRSALRQLIINPVENPVWPQIPTEVWE